MYMYSNQYNTTSQGDTCGTIQARRWVVENGPAAASCKATSGGWKSSTAGYAPILMGVRVGLISYYFWTYHQ